MNRRYLSLSTSVLYLISLFSLLLMLFNAFDIIAFKHSEKIFAGIVVVLSSYAASLLKALGLKEREAQKRLIGSQIIFTFIFYIIMLVDFTLIDDAFGRNILNIFSSDKSAYSEYINTSTNLVPFKTVQLFINGYKNGQLPFFSMLENVLGNFVVFMPLPFFMLCLSPKRIKPITVFITVLSSIIAVELLQFIFMTGASDIDDVILNLSGAMLFYFISKMKKVSEKLKKITFGVWDVREE